MADLPVDSDNPLNNYNNNNHSTTRLDSIKEREEKLKELETELQQKADAYNEKEKRLQELELLLHDKLKTALRATTNDGAGKPFATTADKEPPSDNDVLSLNIGGTTIAVLRRTLTLVEGSLLATKFNGRWDSSLEKDSHGNYFIDLPFEPFMTMINYLRLRALSCFVEDEEDNNILPAPEYTLPFGKILEYYGMTLGIYEIEIIQLTKSLYVDNEQTVTIINNPPDYSVQTQDNYFHTFKLQPRNHKRHIRSYTVQLGNHVQNAKLGWMVERQPVVGSKHCDYPPKEFQKTMFLQFGNRGAGDINGTMAFNCIMKAIYINGVKEKCENNNDDELVGRRRQPLSTVKCEIMENNKPRWVINNDIEIQKGNNDNVISSFLGSSRPFYPCFSVSGSVKIIDVKYAN